MPWRWVVRTAALLVTMAVMVPPARAQDAWSLSFTDAVAVALQENLQLRAAALDVTVAEAQLAAARSARQPGLNAGASYTRAQERAGQSLTMPNPFGTTPPTITITLPPPEADLVVLRLSLQYPLYTGGRIESQIALAEANLRGARAGFRRTAQQIIFSVQQTYLQALLAQETLSAAQRAVDQAEENLRVVQARVQAGAAPQFDALQADVAEANARQAVVRAETAVANAHTTLNLLLNRPLDTPSLLSDSLRIRSVDGTLELAIAQALRDRPDLAELRARIDAIRAGIELASSGARPTVMLGAGYDVTGNPSAASGAWSVTLAVTLSLYDGGLTRARIRETQARMEQLVLLEADRRRTVELEVRQAWLAIGQAGAEVTAASAAATQAREAARLAGVRYQAGVGTALEVVSAQAALAQADVAVASAMFEQNLAWSQLRLASGAAP